MICICRYWSWRAASICGQTKAGHRLSDLLSCNLKKITSFPIYTVSVDERIPPTALLYSKSLTFPHRQNTMITASGASHRQWLYLEYLTGWLHWSRLIDQLQHNQPTYRWIKSRILIHLWPALQTHIKTSEQSIHIFLNIPWCRH